MGSQDLWQYNSCGGKYYAADIDALFANMAAAGASAVRIWFFQPYAVDPSTGLLFSSGQWALYDRIIGDAKAHGLRVIPVLANEGSTCDVNWADTSGYKDLTWYTNGYANSVYSSEPNGNYGGLQLTYKQWVSTIVAHYANEPTIAFWQLMNEAQVWNSAGSGCDGSELSDNTALYNFAIAMTAAIRAVDPNHLVNLGADTSAGPYCGVDTASDLAHVNSSSDLCELHNYNAYDPSAVYTNPCPGRPYFIGERGLTSYLTPAQFLADCTTAFNDDASGYQMWMANDGDQPSNPWWQALTYCFRLTRGSAAAQSYAASVEERGQPVTQPLALSSASEAPPVAPGRATASSEYGPLSCGSGQSCPAGVGGVSIQAPNDTALATIESATPANCNASNPSSPALALRRAAANGCSSIIHVSAVSPAAVVADDVQAQAIAQDCGLSTSGMTSIGDLTVAGIQIVGGPNALVATPQPAPNTTIDLLTATWGQVKVVLNRQAPSSIGGGTGLSVDAVVVTVTANTGTLSTATSLVLGHAEAAAACPPTG